jgi:hypothetical protein
VKSSDSQDKVYLRLIGGFIMKKKSPLRSFGEGPRFRKGRHTEKKVEARLKHLETLVHSLGAAPYPIWLTGTDHICEIVDKLHMKEEAARWILRIMHHFNGQAREVLLSLLERSLDDLQLTVKSEMHTEVAA